MSETLTPHVFSTTWQPKEKIFSYQIRTQAGKFILATTPGKYVLSLIMVLVILSIAIFSTSYSIFAKRATYQRILDHSIELSATTRMLYTSLSDMDVQIADISVNEQLDPQLVANLRNDLSQASRAAIYIGENAGNNDPQLVRDLNTINTHLPDYIHEIDPFLQSNSHPSGAELILTETSKISDTYLLPAADDILNKNMQALDKESKQATAIPYIPLMFIFLAIGALFWVYRLSASKSGRHSDLGILIALIAIFVQFGWILVTGFAGHIAGNQARNLGISDLSDQTSILISGQQARRDELLEVSLPQSSYTYKQNFFANLAHIDYFIKRFHPHTQSGEIFQVNANHLVYIWSKIATSFSELSPQPTVNSSPIGFLDDAGNLPPRSQLLTAVTLTFNDWEAFKTQVHNAISDTADAYTAASHSSYNVWVNAVLVTFICGGLSVIATIVGIMLRLNEFRK